MLEHIEEALYDEQEIIVSGNEESTETIISDISEQIEAGLTTCYGDFHKLMKNN